LLPYIKNYFLRYDYHGTSTIVRLSVPLEVPTIDTYLISIPVDTTCIIPYPLSVSVSVSINIKTTLSVSVSVSVNIFTDCTTLVITRSYSNVEER